MKEMVFLLGGYDLELMEIRRLLDEKGIKYYDKQLEWENANLLQYAFELKKYGDLENVIIYGVELIEKGLDSLPDNYVRIDHHNDFNYKPSSLEQVSALLDIRLTHRQQLIAANDSGYIPGMQALNATPEEIMEIRREDRKVQGVTEADEWLAEEAIAGKVKTGDFIEVYSKTSRFSPICDRLYPYSNLLIYTDAELVYYGEGKDLLTRKFRGEIETGKMFCGGTDSGYIGTVKSIYQSDEIVTLKEQIKFLILNS